MFFGAASEYDLSGQPSRSFDRSTTRPAPPKGPSTAVRDESLPLANLLATNSGQPSIGSPGWRTTRSCSWHVPPEPKLERGADDQLSTHARTTVMSAPKASTVECETPLPAANYARVASYAADSVTSCLPKQAVGDRCVPSLNLNCRSSSGPLVYAERSPSRFVVPSNHQPKLVTAVSRLEPRRTSGRSGFGFARSDRRRTVTTSSVTLLTRRADSVPKHVHLLPARFTATPAS
jgi:hypothetical protein